MHRGAVGLREVPDQIESISSEMKATRTISQFPNVRTRKRSIDGRPLSRSVDLESSKRPRGELGKEEAMSSKSSERRGLVEELVDVGMSCAKKSQGLKPRGNPHGRTEERPAGFRIRYRATVYSLEIIHLAEFRTEWN